MNTISDNKPFNRRAFISMALFVSGLLLPVSGIMNHNLQFDFLTPERHFWMSVHNMSALVFSVSAIFHVVNNGRALIHYARNFSGVFVSKEAMAAAALVVTLVGLFASHAFLAR